MGWFSKSKDKKAKTDAHEEGSIMDFQNVLEKSLTEEKKGSSKEKKQNARARSMVKLLLEYKYTLQEINDFIKAGRQYEVKNREVVEK
jgi:hypothetical protein